MSYAAKVLEEMAEEFDGLAGTAKGAAHGTESWALRLEGYAQAMNVAARSLRARAAELRKADVPPTGGRLPLPKPERVEAGQRWCRLDDWRTVTAVRSGNVVDLSNGRWVTAEDLLHDDRWHYLGNVSVDSPPGGG